MFFPLLVWNFGNKSEAVLFTSNAFTVFSLGFHKHYGTVNEQLKLLGGFPVKGTDTSLAACATDIDSKQLVDAWLVHTTSQEPSISRAFQINLSTGGNTPTQKVDHDNVCDTLK